MQPASAWLGFGCLRVEQRNHVRGPLRRAICHLSTVMVSVRAADVEFIDKTVVAQVSGCESDRRKRVSLLCVTSLPSPHS
jgi:hypothetical protein